MRQWWRVALVTAWFMVLSASASVAQVRASFLYTLSNFGGKLPFAWVRIHVDQARDETYVVYGNLIRVFSASGMETYSFGDDLDVGQIADLAVDRNGHILLLSYRNARPLVTRCDFRGVPMGTIEIKHVPESVPFGPNRMVYRDGLLYFVTTSKGTVIIAGEDGEFREHVDLFSLMALDEREKRQLDGAEVNGFSVDGSGNVFFTVAVLFKAFKLSPERKLLAFGRPGSAPGRFGVIAGITTDSRGNVLVADKLKCVVIAFDKDFNFLTEFGRRGNRPENLIVPDDIGIDARDRLYVTQGRRRGVSVFSLTAD